jgi:hypothetical protein
MTLYMVPRFSPLLGPIHHRRDRQHIPPATHQIATAFNYGLELQGVGSAGPSLARITDLSLTASLRESILGAVH